MERALKPDLECAICHCIYRNATFLNCLHSFCKECIGDLLRNEYDKLGMPHTRGMEVVCPMCRQGTFFKKCSTSDLKQNTLVNNIIQTIKRQRAEKKDSMQRRKTLGSSLDLRGHGGDGSSLELYCKECKVLVDFNKPGFMGHWDHVTSMQPLQNASQQATTQINIILERSMKWLEEHESYQKGLEDLKQRAKRCFTRLEDDVSIAYEAQSERLRDAREKLNADIAARRTTFCSKLDKLLERDRCLTESVVEAQTEGNRHLDAGDAKGTLRAFELWQQKITEALSMEVPAGEKARNEADAVMLLYLEHNPKPAHLGTIKEMPRKR